MMEGMRKLEPVRPIELKDPEREQLAKDMARFFQGGGVIKEIPSGVYGEKRETGTRQQRKYRGTHQNPTYKPKPHQAFTIRQKS